ncbi:Tetratricopeptide-like helical [Niveomyces insectorum RCEF 264]|uniref:Tetratricopeptide-like helical n=1 Tax=Niveomyces insectorum RCEF 264 TaxID=1081102 RepID=A0A168ACI9_9HYPO|nr:Tetratricopeptide-like helical [Niveomyces insectorum RCEF 264]
MADGNDMSQYMELLLRQKATLEAAKVYKGRKPLPSQRKSREQLQFDFLMLAQNAGQKENMLRVTFIGEAYPPCMLPLVDLVPIRIHDLTLETQHRGRVLVVRTFTQPRRLTAIQCAVEDEFGDVDQLSLYNVLPTVVAADMLPCGAIVAIKEPYYKTTANGGLSVRVDHPSDMVQLKPGDPLIPPRLAPLQEKALLPPSVLDLKERGNAAFQKGQWRLANDTYSDAIKAAAASDDNDDNTWRALHRNRAAARLRLGRYEQAITDALAGMVQADTASPEVAKDANTKALYRAGKASYELGAFPEAKQYFEKALELDARLKDVTADLGRVKKRLAEQEDGRYNFSAMAASASKRHTRLDHASFLKNTRVAESPGRGRGLFATKALEPGDVVFVEKALYVAHPTDMGDVALLLNLNRNRMSMGTHALRLYGVIDKLRWNPKLANRYLDLYDGGTFGGGKEAAVVDGEVALDTFRVESIAEFNGFGCPRVKSSDADPEMRADDGHNGSTGIWLQASYANHACLPNAMRSFVGDMMVVRAVRHIRASEEILMGYTIPRDPLSARQKKLKEGYGFTCACPLCQAEEKVPKPLTEKRARIGKKADGFLVANPLKHSSARTIPLTKKNEARALLEQLRATYSSALFDRLPRLACVDIGYWEGHSQGEYTAKDAFSKVLGVLRDCGYFVAIKGGQVTVDRESALPIETVVGAAMYASQACVAMDNDRAAFAFQALAKDVYVTLFGTDDGFEAKYGQ